MTIDNHKEHLAYFKSRKIYNWLDILRLKIIFFLDKYKSDKEIILNFIIFASLKAINKEVKHD
jgi:hypothetical protein